MNKSALFLATFGVSALVLSLFGRDNVGVPSFIVAIIAVLDAPRIKPKRWLPLYQIVIFWLAAMTLNVLFVLPKLQWLFVAILYFVALLISEGIGIVRPEMLSKHLTLTVICLLVISVAYWFTIYGFAPSMYLFSFTTGVYDMLLIYPALSVATLSFSE